jgi:serine/threonine protein kinase
MATEHGSQVVGQRIGNYRLVQLLGSGGFADVYLGEHLHLGSYAAIKVLHTKLTNAQLEEFRQEGRILAHLLHPHIVSVLDFDVQNMMPFLVMSYAPGGTLRLRHPKGSRVPLPMVVEYVEQVASALDYAHGQKLIHRDIKPENMLIDQQGRIVLSDFGVASIAHNTQSQTLAAFAGTIAYIAPEQIQGRPRTASDQYALAVVVYEWLSGERPFQGSVSEVVSQHLMMPPPPLSGRIPDITPAVEKVIFTALAKDPRERYASVGDFAAALAQASKGSTANIFDEHTSPLPAVVAQPFTSANEIDRSEATEVAYVQKSDLSEPSLHTPYPLTPLPLVASTPLPQLAAEAPMGVPVTPSLPQNPPQKSRRQLLLVVVSVLLVVLLVAGGIVTVFARSSKTYTNVSIATTQGKDGSLQTGGTGGTAQATATNNTVVNQGATATIQATSSATATPTPTPTRTPTPKPVSRAAAIASAGPDQLYNVVTSVSPTWSDPLSSQDKNNWTVSANCTFSGGAYHITVPAINTVKLCYANNTNFCNMAVQVQTINFSGRGAGIRFRATPDGKNYGFMVKPEGAYQFVGPSGNIIPYTLTSSPAVHTGYNVSNVITVIARGSNFYFYVNQQFLVSARDSSLSCGEIGLYVLASSSSASASFSNAKVWTF